MNMAIPEVCLSAISMESIDKALHSMVHPAIPPLLYKYYGIADTTQVFYAISFQVINHVQTLRPSLKLSTDSK